TQAPVKAPDTTMAEQADQGGGTLAETSDGSDAGDGTPQDDMSAAIPGVPTYWVYNDGDSTISEDNGVVGPAYGDDGTDSTPPPGSSLPVDGDVIAVGDVSGVGDALMINAADAARLDRGDFQGVLPWTPAWQLHRVVVAFQPAFEADQSHPSLLTSLDFSSA